ncbi:MAG: anti-sigma factor family protein [Ilumatobacteraceae bacterium]
MIELSCSELSDLAAEAALDLLPGDERTLVFEHLEHCAACRGLVEGYVRTADALLVSLPQADVPEELSARLRSAAPTPPRQRHSHLKPVLSAAAVIVVALTFVLFGLRATSNHQYNPLAETGSLVSPSNGRVGSVKVDTGADPWISMKIDGAMLADGTYRCEVLLSSNDTVTLGSLTVASGSGSWNGPLAVDPDHIRVVRVVAGNGDVVAVAGLARADESES